MLPFCNYISKWLDFQVFSDKDYKPEVPSHNLKITVGRKRTHTLVEKSRARSSRCCGCSRVGASHRANLMHLSPLDRNVQEK